MNNPDRVYVYPIGDPKTTKHWGVGMSCRVSDMDVPYVPEETDQNFWAQAFEDLASEVKTCAGSLPDDPVLARLVRIADDLESGSLYPEEGQRHD